MKMKVITLFIVLILSLSSCQAKQETESSTSNIIESSTTLNEDITEENSTSVIVGDTLILELNKTYVFGIDFPTGTYQLEISSSTGQQGGFAFNNSANNCNIGNVYRSGEGGNYLLNARSFDYGATIIVGGNFDSAKLHYISNEIAPDEADACEM